MRIANFLRLTWLECKAAILRVGLGPWVVGAMIVLGAHVQEPSFFRTSGLEIAWPATIATCDAILLVFVSQLLMSPLDRSSAAAARSLGGCIAGSACAFAMLGIGMTYDATGSTPATSVDISWVTARLCLLWVPTFLLAQARWLRHRRLPVRFLVLATVYLMQASMLPASLTKADSLLPRVAAFGASLILALLWIGPTRAANQSMSLHAYRCPR